MGILENASYLFSCSDEVNSFMLPFMALPWAAVPYFKPWARAERLYLVPGVGYPLGEAFPCIGVVPIWPAFILRAFFLVLRVNR